MKKYCLFLLLFIFSITAKAQAQLSEQAQISLMTCSPTDEAVYTLYGHTALRVYDPDNKIDIVFNYGLFDTSRPFFMYHFVKGELDYMLGWTSFNNFLAQNIESGCEVIEQELNLLPEEKQALWQALIINQMPENRTYRYNFFFDNCATRPIAMIENNIQGSVQYTPKSTYPSFRDIINYCTRDDIWLTFGCDMILGLPTDRKMTQRESFFVPDYLKDALNEAVIIRDGQSVPFVLQTEILAPKGEIQVPSPSPLTSPLVCFSALFIVILLLTIIEFRKKMYFRYLDAIVFFAAGCAGCLLFFLSFISVHPSMFPNISLLWLHPLHLLAVVLFCVKKFKMMAFWYHCINFAVILLMSVAWIFVPQHFNIAFIPLIASLLLRSGSALIRHKNSRG